MVEPGAFETCHSEQPAEASKLVRPAAQRIPSRSRASALSKTGYICADPTAIFTLRLQYGGGPYIRVAKLVVISWQKLCRQLGVHGTASHAFSARES